MKLLKGFQSEDSRDIVRPSGICDELGDELLQATKNPQAEVLGPWHQSVWDMVAMFTPELRLCTSAIDLGFNRSTIRKTVFALHDRGRLLS